MKAFIGIYIFNIVMYVAIMIGTVRLYEDYLLSQTSIVELMKHVAIGIVLSLLIIWSFIVWFYTRGEFMAQVVLILLNILIFISLAINCLSYVSSEEKSKFWTDDFKWYMWVYGSFFVVATIVNILYLIFAFYNKVSSEK